MHLVALVEHVGNDVGGWAVDHGGRDDIWHVPRVLVLRQTQFGVGIKLPNGTQVNVAAQNRDSHRSVDSQILQILNDDCALLFVILGCPVVIEIVENLIAAVDLVHILAEHACPTEGLDRAHQS